LRSGQQLATLVRAEIFDEVAKRVADEVVVIANDVMASAIALTSPDRRRS
jgi:hypothetical protein